MSTLALEKAQEWQEMNHEDDILMWDGLKNLFIFRHIQNDIPLLTMLIEIWDQDTNSFHLPLGEMMITLLDV